MDFGLTMPTHGLLRRDERDFFLQSLPAAEMRPIEVAQLAERLGYHSVWFSDHVCMGRDEGAFHTANTSGTRAYPNRATMLDMIATMGAIAGATSTIRMASSVWIAPYRHPLVAAHQLATVDVLSGGRLIVGVGSGWDPQEFAAVGGDFEHRGSVTEEQIEIFKHAWTEPYLDFRGRFYEIRDVSLEPKPVQKPHPPLVFGAVSEVGARRAARTCDASTRCSSTASATPRASSICARPSCARPSESDATSRASGCTRSARGSSSPAATSSRRRTPRMTLTGTADQVLSDIERFAAAGYSHLTMHFDVRSGSMAEYLEIATRFAEDVLPAAGAIAARPFA